MIQCINPALPANIEFELEGILSIQVVLVENNLAVRIKSPLTQIQYFREVLGFRSVGNIFSDLLPSALVQGY